MEKTMSGCAAVHWEVSGSIMCDAEDRVDTYAGGTDAGGGAWNGPLTTHWIHAFDVYCDAMTATGAVKAALAGRP